MGCPAARRLYLQSAIIGLVNRADETAGSLLQRARVGAGLSQVELAFRAGVVQSVISAYEAGRRQPSLPTLARLIDAAGCDLVVDIQYQPPQLGRLSGPMGRQVRRKRRDLVAAAANHDVTNLRVFGSVARGEDRPDSDVDGWWTCPRTWACSGWDRSRLTWRPSSAPRSTWCQQAI